VDDDLIHPVLRASQYESHPCQAKTEPAQLDDQEPEEIEATGGKQRSARTVNDQLFGTRVPKPR
jgi:hypothetical protein